MKFRKMASVLLAASLLIGCAAAENRTIFKKLSEEESMANEALPVEERAESFSPAGLLSLKDRAAILVQDDTSRLYSLYTWQPGQQEMALVASNMYRAGGYAQLKDLQERLENLKEDALAGTELPDAAHCFSMLVTDGEKVYGINHLTGGIFTISGENGKAVYNDVATMQDTKIFIQEEEDYSYALLPDTVAASGNTVLMLMNTWDDKGQVTNLYTLSLTDGSVRKVNVENPRNLCAYKDGKFLVIASQKKEDWDENGNRILDEEADYSGYFRDIQWKNKAITELYYPGSVFKVITSAMGIDSGLANINTTFTCAGAYGVAKETYHCAGHKAHGTITLAEALRQSCNIYYIQLGQRIGSQTFYDYFDAFGFTSRTGVDLPSETNFMQYYKADQLGEVQLASSAFGQAMAITPLQMCTAVAAAVNGGYLVTPHVVDKITDSNGNVIEEVGANVRRQVISASTSDAIRQIMEYEVGNGTGGGKYAYVSGYRIGGKSGTSEQLNMDRRTDGDYKKVASFAAVLPADDPEIIVYVMLDDPNNAKTDYSSLLAAPVVGNIISEVAPYLGIATDGEDRSGTTVTVPNLVGTEWSSAQVQLNIKGLKHQLAESESSQTAAAVTYQYPHAGAKVAYGTTVYLYTDTYEGQHTEVPDVTGKSADFARQMLSAAGLNCVVEGDANGTVQAQSEDAGASVQRGSIITITCG